MPRWIGRAYSHLWTKFKMQPFYFEEVSELLGKFTPNYLSELKKYQVLYIFGRAGRKKVYRLVPPDLITWAIAQNIDLKWLKQGAYALLILYILKQLKEEFKNQLLAAGIFGSVARNEAHLDSDIDLLLIFETLPDSIGERIKLLLKTETALEVQQEFHFLNERGIFPHFSYHALKEAEFEITPLLIDASFDLKILYDTGILDRFMFEISKKVRELDIKRISLSKDQYYLDLKIPFGKVISL